jgi:mRNA-degrading endonuclease RelE of RelBE toxin-antitoxin system
MTAHAQDDHGLASMLRSPHRVFGPYRVLFSSEAWRKIGQISSDTFQVLQAAMDQVARALTTKRLEGEDATTELRVHTQGLEIIYQRDDEKRTVTLLDFAVTDAEP